MDDDTELNGQARDVITEFLRRLANVDIALALRIAKYLLIPRDMDNETKQAILQIRALLQNISELLPVLGTLDDVDEGVTIKEYLRRIWLYTSNTYLLNKDSYVANYFASDDNIANVEFDGYVVVYARLVEWQEVQFSGGTPIAWKPRKLTDPVTMVSETGEGIYITYLPDYQDYYIALLRLYQNRPRRVPFSVEYYIKSLPYSEDTGFVISGSMLPSFGVLRGNLVPLHLHNRGIGYEAFFPGDQSPEDYDGIFVRANLYGNPNEVAIIEDDDKYILYILRKVNSTS